MAPQKKHVVFSFALTSTDYNFFFLHAPVSWAAFLCLAGGIQSLDTLGSLSCSSILWSSQAPLPLSSLTSGQWEAAAQGRRVRREQGGDIHSTGSEASVAGPAAIPVDWSSLSCHPAAPWLLDSDHCSLLCPSGLGEVMATPSPTPPHTHHC